MRNETHKNIKAHETEVYRDFHSFIPIKSQVEERCKTQSGHGDNNKVLIILS